MEEAKTHWKVCVEDKEALKGESARANEILAGWPARCLPTFRPIADLAAPSPQSSTGSWQSSAMASLFRGGQDPSELPAQLLLLSTLRLVTSAPDQAFTHVRTAPVHTLSHVLANYLALLGQNAKARAEVGGRATVTLADAMGAIGEMGTSTKQMVEYVEQLKRSSGVGPERERHQAFAQSGELLKSALFSALAG